MWDVVWPTLCLAAGLLGGTVLWQTTDWPTPLLLALSAIWCTAWTLAVFRVWHW